jgi:hypothetical protein
MSSFGLYVIGFLVLIAGLAYGAFLLGVPQVWIGVGVVVLLGIGIISGVGRTRRPDTSPTEPPVARERVVERER